MENKPSLSTIGTIAVGVVTVIALLAIALRPPTVIVVPSESASLGTALTQNTQTQSFTDGSDLYQNVQAISERMASGTQYQILQADSSGNMQLVAPTALAGIFNFTQLGVNTTTPVGEIDAYGGSATSSLSLDTDGTNGSCIAVRDVSDGSWLFVTFDTGVLATSTVDCR